jgi:hypothetical protein
MTTSQAAKEFCRATLTYGPGTSKEFTIEDGRVADLPGWEECGFELLSHRSAVTDWTDDEEIARTHYPEITELVRKITGCDHALLSSHIKRSPDDAKRHSDLSPIPLVHSDFADSYGDLLRKLYADGDRAEAAEREGVSPDVVVGARRLMILQFWRNLGAPKMDLPLAFCDARDVPRGALQPFTVKNYAGSGFDFEALAFAAPEDAAEHHWYGFPEMTIDEVVAFRTYDSDRVGSDEPYWTPHSAFRDPEVELGNPSRSSIEVRPLCIWA